MVEVQDQTGVSRGGDMVRCDVFFVEGEGYYFVPVYVSDTVKEQLPMYAPTQGDDNGIQIMKKMDDSNFIFSLYKNDLIKLYGKKTIKLSLQKKLIPNSTLAPSVEVAGEDGVFLYYSTFDRNTTKITGVIHDDTYQFCSSCKTVPKIEKYEVDILGNVGKVGKETRKTFDRRKKG
jgi:CRISPR-associated endonuclease Csn1